MDGKIPPPLAFVNASSPALSPVQVLARAKRLPEEFLRDLGVEDSREGGVVIRYKDQDGSFRCYRVRRAAGCEPRFLWVSGPGQIPYLAWMLPRWRTQQATLHICESESDAWTLLFAGCAVIAAPGSGCTRAINDEHFAGFPSIVLQRQNDQA